MRNILSAVTIQTETLSSMGYLCCSVKDRIIDLKKYNSDFIFSPQTRKK